MEFDQVERICKTISAAAVAIVAIVKTGYVAVGVIAFLALIFTIKDV